MRVVRGLLLLLLMVALAPAARGELRIDITRGRVEPLLMAVSDFLGAPVRADIAGVVAADLEPCIMG